MIVEISDPSCPFCHAAAGKNPELSKQMSQDGKQFVLTSNGGSYLAPVLEAKKLLDAGKASFAYIYSNGHGNGELSTQALYCAFEKGDFWGAHDLLMSKEGYTIINDVVKNDKAQIPKLAEFLSDSTDKNDLIKCLEDGKYEAKLASDQALASSLGSRGTPGFFINDTKFSGAVNFDPSRAFRSCSRH